MLSLPNAKINLGLNIVEKRDDGFHNLETILYPISLRETVEIIDAEFTRCKVHGVEVPGDADENLCLKAFRLMQQDYNIPNQEIHLLKYIPVGAGLGGGSADCAFVIKLVNAKFGLGLSDFQLEDYARKLGTDCAFFIKNEPVYAVNKGDEFEVVQVDLSVFFKVVVKPPIHVSTADAYANVKPKKSLQSLKEIIHLPATTWKNKVTNDFEDSVFVKYPQIHQIKTSLYDAGATFALMSGSGSSVFALFNKPVELPELEENNLVFYNV